MSQVEETPASLKDTKDAASTVQKSPKADSIITNLDATIAGFGDGHIFPDTDMSPASSCCSSISDKTDHQANALGDGIVERFSPPGLEEPFKQLHSILFPALHRGHAKDGIDPARAGPATLPLSSPSSKFQNPISSSSAAILMGVKGSGKTLLLERVLAACREQLQYNPGGGRRRLLYRMVEINGIVCRGEDVASVVYEIIRQLSDIAYRSIQTTKAEESPLKATRKIRRTSGDDSDTTGKRGFSSDSILRHNDGKTEEGNETGRLGGNEKDDSGDESIFVHDDDDANTRKRKARRQRRKQRKIDKHMLRLRRATFNSNLSLLESILEFAAADDIPIILNLDELDSFTDEGERQMLLYHLLDRVATPGSNLVLLGTTSSFSALTLLEKRIRSRAEGTSKIIYLRTPPTYHGLLELLDYKLKGCVARKDILDRLAHPKDIEAKAREIVSKKGLGARNGHGNHTEESTDEIVKLSVAMEREFRVGRDTRWFSRVIATSLSLYRHDCIMAMSFNDSSVSSGTPLSDGAPPNFCAKYIRDAMAMMGASVLETMAASGQQPDLCIVDGVAASPRLQALLDLSTPQVALMLSARRILKREEQRELVVLAPLTLERMLKEYESFRRGSKSMGNSKLLKRAASHLMEQGLLVPSMDHSGGGPLQYDVSKMYRTLDNYTLLRLPLHIPYDINRELGKALEQNLLECPTALKEWARFISKAA